METGIGKYAAIDFNDDLCVGVPGAHELHSYHSES
jgi:hypothetical protein